MMKNTNLWAINIPEEPDSEDILHPVSTKEIGEKVVARLREEARQQFTKVGGRIAESITLEAWNKSEEEHTRYLLENKNWWVETTFLDEVK